MQYALKMMHAKSTFKMAQALLADRPQDLGSLRAEILENYEWLKSVKSPLAHNYKPFIEALQKGQEDQKSESNRP